MIKKTLIFLSSSVLFLLVLWLSFWLSLSEDRLLAWSQYQLEQLLPGEIESQIEGMRTRIWGLDIDGFELKNRRTEQSLLKMTAMQVRFDLFSIILRQELPFRFTLYGGNGQGTLGFFPNPIIRIGASSIALNWHPLVRKSGLVKSNPDLTLRGEYLPNSETGTVVLEVENLVLSGNTAHTNLSLDLPDTTLATVTADLSLVNDQLTLAVATSGDITAKLNGKITGNSRRIQRSRIDLELRAEITDAYQTKLGLLKNILDSYRSTTGEIAVRLTGNLLLPQIRKI